MTRKLSEWPDEHGRFSAYGGAYVPESVTPALVALHEGYTRAARDRHFDEELSSLLREFAGRPTPLMMSRSLKPRVPGANVWIKRDDLSHTGSHAMASALGFVLLARKMGAKGVLTPGDDPAHARAVACACARVGVPCTVFLPANERDADSRVRGMLHALGARAEQLPPGLTAQDCNGAAMRAWERAPLDTFYVPSSCAAPHPYPALLREFLRVIGNEVKAQSLRQSGKLPNAIVCAPCLTPAMHPFIDDARVALFVASTTPLNTAHPTVQGGALTTVDIGPELRAWIEAGRVRTASVPHEHASHARSSLARSEGLVVSEEDGASLAASAEVAAGMAKETNLVVCLKGRDDCAQAWPARAGA